MGIREFLRPNAKKAAIYDIIILVVILGWGTFSANPNVLIITSTFLSLPRFLFHPANAALLAPPVLLAYFYFLACIYASAYSWLDSALRRKYPGINAKWEKRRRAAKSKKAKGFLSMPGK